MNDHRQNERKSKANQPEAGKPQNTRLPCELLRRAMDTVEVIGLLKLIQISSRA